MMTVRRFIPYARQSINDDDIASVSGVLNSDMITRGDATTAFEKAIASYCGASYAVAFSSGSTALKCAYFAAEASPYDRILSTPNTFVATLSAASKAKALPVFVDIDRKSGNISLDATLDNINKDSSRGRTFFVPVHFAGIALDMKAVDATINDPDTVVIEDAAHAFGSHYPSGERVGSCCYSLMTMFSFHPAKTVTSGEGGAITTNSPEIAARLRLARNNGIAKSDNSPLPWFYDVVDATGNYHMTEMQAALGHSQLKRVDAFIEKRRRLVERYRSLLSNVDNLSLFDSIYDPYTAYHLLVVQIDFDAFNTTREKVMGTLKEKGIGTQVHYIPIYRHNYFRRHCGDIAVYFPNMEAYYKQTLSLPLYYDLSFDEVEYVVQSLKKAL